MALSEIHDKLYLFCVILVWLLEPLPTWNWVVWDRFYNKERESRRKVGKLSTDEERKSPWRTRKPMKSGKTDEERNSCWRTIKPWRKGKLMIHEEPVKNWKAEWITGSWWRTWKPIVMSGYYAIWPDKLSRYL